MNSEAMSIATHSVMEATADQASRVSFCVSFCAVRCVMGEVEGVKALMP